MFSLLLIFAVFGIIFLLLVFFNQKGKGNVEKESVKVDDECCGAHEVCERDSLLNTNTKIVYFDDEELDALSHLNADNYDEEQLKMISEVFYTLREEDVADWLCSLQLRHIELPQDIKDAALLIIGERRNEKG